MPLRPAVASFGLACLVLGACAPFGAGRAALMHPEEGCGAPRGKLAPLPAPRWIARSSAAANHLAAGERVVPRWLARRTGRPRTCIACDYTDPSLEPVRSLRFTSDGSRLVVGGDKRVTTVWDLQAGEPATAFRPATEDRLMMFVQAISPDGRLVSQRMDDTLELWDTREHVRVRGLGGHRKDSQFSEAIDGAAFDPSGTLIATGDEKGTLRLWGVADGRLLRTFHVGDGRLQALAFSPDRRLVAAGSRDAARVLLLDVETGERFADLPTEADELFYVAWSADGRKLAAADFTESVVVWDLVGCKRIALRDRVRDHRGWRGFLSGLAITPNGDRVVGSFGEGGLGIWDAATGTRVLLVEPLEDDEITEVAISPGGELLATGTALGTVLWRLPTMEPLVFLAQSTADPGTAYVLDLVRPEADVDVFGARADPWPEFAGHFDAFGGGAALLTCRARDDKAERNEECTTRQRVPGLLRRRLLGE